MKHGRPVLRRPGRLRKLLVVIVVACGLLVVPAGAHAADSTGYGYTYQGAGASFQYMSWNRSTRKIRLKVFADVGMNPDNCMDAMADWHTTNGDHYDARVVRVCLPGGTEETDPGADGYWIEPSDWDGRPVDGLRIAGGYVMDDDYPFVIKWGSVLPESVSSSLYPATSGTPPRTPPSDDYWARVRTLYQDGHVQSGNPTPEHCFGRGNLPWNCT